MIFFVSFHQTSSESLLQRIHSLAAFSECGKNVRKGKSTETKKRKPGHVQPELSKRATTAGEGTNPITRYFQARSEQNDKGKLLPVPVEMKTISLTRKQNNSEAIVCVKAETVVVAGGGRASTRYSEKKSVSHTQCMVHKEDISHVEEKSIRNLTVNGNKDTKPEKHTLLVPSKANPVINLLIKKKRNMEGKVHEKSKRLDDVDERKTKNLKRLHRTTLE